MNGRAEPGRAIRETRPAGPVVPSLIAFTVLGGLISAGLAFYGDITSVASLAATWTWWGIGQAWLLSLACRFARWHDYIRLLCIALPLRISFFVFLSGVAMKITPASAGEALKALLLRDGWAIRVEDTLPAVIAERLTDLIAMVLVVGALSGLFPGGLAASLVGVAVAGALISICVSRRVGEAILRIVVRVPRLARICPKLRDALEALWQTTSPPVLMRATGLATVAFAFDGVGLLVLSRAAGIDGLDLAACTFIYTLPVLAGAVMLLPGSLGVAEVAMAALIQCIAGDAANSYIAASLTLATRLLTLWLQVALGIVALLILSRTVARRRKGFRS